MALVKVLLFLMFFIPSVFSANYLYSPGPKDNEDVSPIIDYILPEKKVYESNDAYAERSNNPDFLSSLDEGPRVVKFYAPWCGHCQHYKPIYIEMGREVQKTHPQIKFYAVSCPVHKKICQINNVKGYPTLIYYAKNSINGVVIDKFNRRNLDAKKLIKNYYRKGLTESELQHDEEIEEKDMSSVQKQQQHTDKKKSIESNENIFGERLKQSSSSKENKEDVYINAALSFEYALRNSIFLTNNELDTVQSSAFKGWLNVLYHTLPESRMQYTTEQVTLLMTNLHTITKSEDELVNVLQQQESKNLDVREWTTSCSKGVEGAGYTCGLWQLFHIMTIGLVHYNKEKDHAISTLYVADSLRDYIEQFFACEECRLNFLKMYDDCQFERCNRLHDGTDGEQEFEQLALWLWEVHNDVNVRLLREDREEKGLPELRYEGEQEARFPSRDDCPLCWHDNGGWNEDVVYRFLEYSYWPSRDVLETHFQHNTLQSEESTSHPKFLSISLIILVVYIYLRTCKNKRRNKGRKKW